MNFQASLKSLPGDFDYCYFGVTDLTGFQNSSQLLVGDEPYWDLDSFLLFFERKPSLRSQLNRAKNKGIVIQQWDETSLVTKKELRDLTKQWLADRRCAPLHFMAMADWEIKGKQIYVALLPLLQGCPKEKPSRLLAFLVGSVGEKIGYVDQIIRSSCAPNGTSELLIHCFASNLKDEGCSKLSMGLIPLSSRLDYAKNPFWVRILFWSIKKWGVYFYNFDGLEEFKYKFGQAKIRPAYVVSSEKKVSWKLMSTLFKVFSGVSALGRIEEEIRRKYVYKRKNRVCSARNL